jgi:hypothetical protein
MVAKATTNDVIVDHGAIELDRRIEPTNARRAADLSRRRRRSDSGQAETCNVYYIYIYILFSTFVSCQINDCRDNNDPICVIDVGGNVLLHDWSREGCVFTDNRLFTLRYSVF